MTEQEAPSASYQDAPQGAPAEEPAEEPAKKGKTGWIIGIVVTIAIIGGVAFGFREALAFFTGDTSKAVAGDCITDAAGAGDIKIVDCTDTAAAFKVVGVLEDQTQAGAEAGCVAFSGAEQYLIEYEGTLTDGTKGRILCLAGNG